jgi:hypothetical protein
MWIGDILDKFLGTYETRARLYPALLVSAPMFGVAVGEYGVSLDLKHGLFALFVAFGGLYLIANIAREYGKRLESQLYRKWGGVPTTQLQRHRDNTIESPTKLRRHQILSEKLNVPFPSSAEEEANPSAADATYAAGTRWLLEHTRTRPKFELLFNENIAYGYRRNAVGLKPLAITICLGAIGWVIYSAGIIDTNGVHRLATTHFTPGDIGSLIISVGLLLTWLFFFTQRTVRTAAFSYADMLLRACELL